MAQSFTRRLPPEKVARRQKVCRGAYLKKSKLDNMVQANLLAAALAPKRELQPEVSAFTGSIRQKYDAMRRWLVHPSPCWSVSGVCQVWCIECTVQ